MFIEYILQRGWEEGIDVYEKVREIIDEGETRGSLKLDGFEGMVEVGDREHVVKVIGGVRSDCVMTYSRRRASNKAVRCAYARAYAPEVRRREVFNAGGDADWEEAEGVQHEGRLGNDLECYEGYLGAI